MVSRTARCCLALLAGIAFADDVGAASSTCRAGEACEPVDQEAEALKVSLLQRKREDVSLLDRRVQLIDELNAIDKELEEAEKGAVQWGKQCNGIGEKSCKGAVEWAINEGIKQHPQWYPNLNKDSSCADFQAHLASINQANCVAPDQPADESEAEPEPLPAPVAPAASGDLPFGHPTPGKKYPVHPGFTLWLVEEFDAPIDLDNDAIWTWGDGAMSQVRFVQENLVFEDGKLKVKVTRNHGHQPSCSHAFAESIKPTPLLSGEMRTKHNMFRYGRYEMSHKAPMVKHNGDDKIGGNYISTMFVYRDLNERHWREVDWEITGDNAHSVTTNVLYADNTIKWRPDIAKVISKEHHNVNTRTGFHEYAFEWLPDKLVWYIDGKQIREERKAWGAKIPEMSTKIMMNLWIFEAPIFAFGGHQGRNNEYPMNNEYDWFRFYKWNGDKHYPCADASESCLTDDDKYLSGNNPKDGIKMVGRHRGWPCK